MGLPPEGGGNQDLPQSSHLSLLPRESEGDPGQMARPTSMCTEMGWHLLLLGLKVLPCPEPTGLGLFP